MKRIKWSSELLPTTAYLDNILKQERYKKRYRSLLASTVSVLTVVAAIAILVATLLLPVLKIYGSSMTPTLEEGNIIFSVKGMEMKRGEIVAFYYNNKVLVKRLIAFPGEWIDIDDTGYVSINGEPLDEPYLKEHAKGDLNIDLPYQVPEGKYFVMGDHRSTSIDSRNTAVGCVAEEQLVGRIVFRVWPLKKAGRIR
ncbi:signal peptidase I [Dorea sp.]